LRSHDLGVSAVVCPLRRGLDDPDNLEPRLEQIRLTMALAFELGPRLVVIQAGQLPVKENEPRTSIMRDSLEVLGRHGDRTGVMLALDAGLDAPQTLVEYLDRLDVGSLAVNYNPANLVINGHNAYDAVKVFQRRLAHVHAQDARRINPSKLATVPLGHGDIDWLQLLANFAEIEYRGYLTVLGDDRAELAAGVSFLKRFVM
jgi:L-ribulose-5-phosphate 3-epimerase